MHTRHKPIDYIQMQPLQEKQAAYLRYILISKQETKFAPHKI